MSSVTLEEAQARLPRLLEQLQPGEEITITRAAVGPGEEGRAELVALQGGQCQGKDSHGP
jgi:antitoxin (DNA-binding transcriptional repressor) of toxin-antitoxin stability system